MKAMKTTETDDDVNAFLASVDPSRQADCKALVAMMQTATGAPPKMWGRAIIGFGNTHYKYESGREGDWFLIGFSPRKSDLTLYLGSLEEVPALVAKVGKCKTGKGCLYIKSLSQVDVPALRKLVDRSVASKKKNLEA